MGNRTRSWSPLRRTEATWKRQLREVPVVHQASPARPLKYIAMPVFGVLFVSQHRRLPAARTAAIDAPVDDKFFPVRLRTHDLFDSPFRGVRGRSRLFPIRLLL